MFQFFGKILKLFNPIRLPVAFQIFLIQSQNQQRIIDLEILWTLSCSMNAENV